jgi:excisionase family DNA binding protein
MNTENQIVPMLISASEAAKVLAVSPRTLYTLTQRGELACVKIGRCVRYAPDALQEFIQKNTLAISRSID